MALRETQMVNPERIAVLFCVVTVALALVAPASVNSQQLAAPPANSTGAAPPADSTGAAPPGNSTGAALPANPTGATPPANAQGAAPPSDGASADTVNGQQLFATSCGWCHQSGGRVAGRGPKLAGNPNSDEYLMNRIRTGKLGAMPAFGGAFTEPQLRAIVAYIRALKDPDR
jgi:mono/diheme cytochrome c family protein